MNWCWAATSSRSAAIWGWCTCALGRAGGAAPSPPRKHRASTSESRTMNQKKPPATARRASRSTPSHSRHLFVPPRHTMPQPRMERSSCASAQDCAWTRVQPKRFDPPTRCTKVSALASAAPFGDCKDDANGVFMTSRLWRRPQPTQRLHGAVAQANDREIPELNVNLWLC